MKARISEVFQSYQGEGLYFGEKHLFVRFFGCNLSCSFCDTPQRSYMELDAQELSGMLLSARGDGCDCVSFTGGEPLLQSGFLRRIMPLTRQHGFRNYLETNGTLPQALSEVVELCDIIAMDFKLPSSSGLEDHWQEHIDFLKIARCRQVFVKAVVCLSTKEEELARLLEEVRNIDPSIMVVLQPNSRQDRGLLDKKIEGFRENHDYSQQPVCVIPQMHRIAGVR